MHTDAHKNYDHNAFVQDAVSSSDPYDLFAQITAAIQLVRAGGDLDEAEELYRRAAEAGYGEVMALSICSELSRAGGDPADVER